jgi:membrane associated rhomboid family serine protease
MPHLLGNLFSIVLFGLLLEAAVGSQKFLKVLFWAAVFGNLAAIGSYNAVLGISGGIYGLIGALTVLRPKMVLWLSGLPMPMILVGVVYATIDLLGALAPVSNTGHLAHLAGFVVGVAYGFLFRKDDGGPGSSRSRSSLREDEKRRIDAHLDAYERRYLNE